MNEQHDLLKTVLIDKDIKGKVVLCAGKDADALTNWATAQGAKKVCTVYNPEHINENFDLPKSFKRVDTVIAHQFLTEIATQHDQRCFVGMCKRLKVDAFYVEVAKPADFSAAIDAVGEFGYLVTASNFKDNYRMQLDDGKI